MSTEVVMTVNTRVINIVKELFFVALILTDVCGRKKIFFQSANFSFPSNIILIIERT